MTARSIRRAMERKAAKAAAKKARLQQVAAQVDEPALCQRGEDLQVDEPALCQRGEDLHVVRQLSEAQLTANRANSQSSTGPRTESGKAISSINAVKTGLTGRTVLLPSDDVEAYQHHLATYEKEFQPVGLRERELVQSIADTQWRLLRIPGLEMAIYAKGRDEFADQFQELAPAVRNARIDLETTLQYQKSLRNLQLQESRLRRHREKDMTELKALQAERRAVEQTEQELAARATKISSQPGDPRDLASYFQTSNRVPNNLLPVPVGQHPLAA